MEVRPERQDLALREAEALALRGDHAALSEFLAMLDRRSDVASSAVRFATAIAAMARGQFLAAAAAWDDRQHAPPDLPGTCWADADDPAGLPASRQAARVLAATCEEVASLRQEVSALRHAAASAALQRSFQGAAL